MYATKSFLIIYYLLGVPISYILTYTFNFGVKVKIFIFFSIYNYNILNLNLLIKGSMASDDDSNLC